MTLRNQIKLQARELMADQKLAKTLLPPSSLSKLARGSYEKNNVGNEFWKYILNSSVRTNPQVDKTVGVQNPNNIKKV